MLSIHHSLGKILYGKGRSVERWHTQVLMRLFRGFGSGYGGEL